MARSSRGSRSRRSSTTVTMPGMKGVETRQLVAEGEYLVEVLEVEKKEGDKAEYLSWKFGIVDDKKFEGATLFHNTSFAEQSLFNLRALLEALGADVPDEPEEIDLSDYKEMQMMVAVGHESWQGKKQAKIVDFWAAEEEEESEREERGRRGGKDKKDRRGGKEEKNDRGGRRGKGKKEEAETYTADQVNDMDQDELAEVIKEAELDVDLDKFRTLRKMQNAVVDALEKADLLEKE